MMQVTTFPRTIPLPAGQYIGDSVTPENEFSAPPMLRLTSEDWEAHSALARNVARRLAALQIANVVIDEGDLLRTCRPGDASDGMSAEQSSRALARMAARFAPQGCVVIVVAGNTEHGARSSLEVFAGGMQHHDGRSKVRFSLALDYANAASGRSTTAEEDAETIMRAILLSISRRRTYAAPVIRAA